MTCAIVPATSTTQRRDGFALMTTLIISAVMLTVGGAFLAYVSSDYRFAAEQHASTGAYYLASSGLTYYQAVGMPPAPSIVNVPSNDPTHRFQLFKDAATANITSVGTVLSASGKVLARRTLVAPGGNVAAAYEALR